MRSVTRWLWPGRVSFLSPGFSRISSRAAEDPNETRMVCLCADPLRLTGGGVPARPPNTGPCSLRTLCGELGGAERLSALIGGEKRPRQQNVMKRSERRKRDVEEFSQQSVKPAYTQSSEVKLHNGVSVGGPLCLDPGNRSILSCYQSFIRIHLWFVIVISHRMKSGSNICPGFQLWLNLNDLQPYVFHMFGTERLSPAADTLTFKNWWKKRERWKRGKHETGLIPVEFLSEIKESMLPLFLLLEFLSHNGASVFVPLRLQRAGKTLKVERNSVCDKCRGHKSVNDSFSWNKNCHKCSRLVQEVIKRMRFILWGAGVWFNGKLKFWKFTRRAQLFKIIWLI